MSIGEVLTALRGDFPDVTISKIRFLEAEGLVEPERTASGYRKFSRADVNRLRYVLGAQRDRYLPLRVIKDQLEQLDRGLQPAAPGDSGGPKVARALTAVDDGPSPEDFLPEPTELRLSRAELLSTAGLDDAQLSDLEQFGLLWARPGGHYDSNALLVAQTVAAMHGFGIEARHLRPFKTAADREIGLVQQVVSPLAGGRTPEARARAEEAVRELAALSVRLHAALVRAGLHAEARR
ncbi:MAG TPA: MerR family transcriptional regulator [Mycobacteriales bacterium]